MLLAPETFANRFLESCLSTTKGLTIAGNDLNGVKGAATDCCQLCQQKFGCRAWTWDSFNGGTCWLKNDTQPLSKSGSPGALTGFVSPSADRVYSTKYEWNATNFWDAPWHFDQWALTSVTKNVDKATAQSLNMIGYNNSRVYMGVDHVYPYPISGRPSIQIASTYLFNSGLFVLSLEHMPTGPGVWPSWWMTGPDWPNKGEIDIMEGIFNMTYNMNSILTGNTTKVSTHLMAHSTLFSMKLEAEFLQCNGIHKSRSEFGFSPKPTFQQI
uniref:GH16 domain-containing protein n=1 Tax=Acrobeloides nanus TaxID=290746 RepID=A0A914D3K2_9BILA